MDRPARLSVLALEFGNQFMYEKNVCVLFPKWNPWPMGGHPKQSGFIGGENWLGNESWWCSGFCFGNSGILLGITRGMLFW